MGWFDFLTGKKAKQGDARPFIKDYLDENWEDLLANWAEMIEDAASLGGVFDKKEMMRKEVQALAEKISAILKENNLRPPANLTSLIREEINERILADARPVIREFVVRYRKPGVPWPQEIDIPWQDMSKLDTALAEKGVDLSLLQYDVSEEKIRSLLDKYGIRKRPSFQDAEAWARTFSYSNEDIIALKAALRKDNVYLQAVEHCLGNLRALVKDELASMQDEWFEASFRKANPELPEKPSKMQWVAAYVKTFFQDRSYLGYLQRLASKHGVTFSTEELEKMVTSEIEVQKISRS
ncbi:MAG TPA: deoxyribodipyrimidine photo-lyase [Syntrophothermus lipocalidus]|nr:deoxyribodipyrimidine photo-lyase [Syntrophothermus lipocalidus]